MNLVGAMRATTEHCDHSVQVVGNISPKVGAMRATKKHDRICHRQRVRREASGKLRPCSLRSLVPRFFTRADLLPLTDCVHHVPLQRH
jgi:hypothetical protein